MLNFESDKGILSVRIMEKTTAGKRHWPVFVSVLALLSLTTNGPLDKDLILSLETRQVEDLSTESCKFVIYINIANVSSKRYFLNRYRYRFIVEEKEYLQLNRTLPERVEVSPAAKTMIAIPVKITYKHLFETVEKTRNLDQAACYLMGELFFSDERKERGGLPIAYSGDFPIFKIPRLEVLDLKANSVSLGGADLDFQFKFLNSNGFDLRVRDIHYSLRIDQFLISEGRIEGDKDITQKSERIFSLHLLINYFDVGKDVHAVLQKENVLVGFEGEIDFWTSWGRMEIPFSWNEKMVLSKKE